MRSPQRFERSSLWFGEDCAKFCGLLRKAKLWDFEATLFEDMKVRKNNDKCTVWNLKFPSKEKKST